MSGLRLWLEYRRGFRTQASPPVVDITSGSQTRPLFSTFTRVALPRKHTLSSLSLHCFACRLRATHRLRILVPASSQHRRLTRELPNTTPQAARQRASCLNLLCCSCHAWSFSKVSHIHRGTRALRHAMTLRRLPAHHPLLRFQGQPTIA